MNIHVAIWPFLLCVSGCAGSGDNGNPPLAGKGSHEGESVMKVGQTALERGVRLNFKRRGGQSIIRVTIAWDANLGREYSDIGPVRSLVVEEDGKIFETVKNVDLREIEDIDLKSIGLRSDEVGRYEVSMAWGVGEDLSNPRILIVE